MADDDPSSRFAHLLQPIRDLALNWDIDIASALEDYLDDLEGITVTLGSELQTAVAGEQSPDGEMINFAEAALLIQGSALIYSKKVEYLFQLVHHTLEVLSSQKAAAKTAKPNANAVAEDEAAFKEAPFLLLDDHIKEVSLKEMLFSYTTRDWYLMRLFIFQPHRRVKTSTSTWTKTPSRLRRPGRPARRRTTR